MTIKGYCKKSNVNTKTGLAPLYITIRDGRSSVKNLSLGKSIPPEKFDNASGFFVGQSGETGKINAFIRSKIGKIDKIISQLDQEGIEPTPSIIKVKYLNKDLKGEFIDFAKQELQRTKHVMGIDTYQDHTSGLIALEKYAPHISFAQLDLTFLEEFKSYLIGEQGRKANGAYHVFSTIRKFWNVAKKRGIVKDYPFENFDMPKEKTIPVFLVLDEVGQLFKLWEIKVLSPKLQNSLYWFLFACFTGWRYKDINIFSKQVIEDIDLQEEILARGFLEIKTSKSNNKKTCTIHLSSPKLRELVENIPSQAIKQDKERIKKDILELFNVLGIKKKITFHGTRHTFAVMCKQLGMDTAAVRDLLTHSSIVTTEIYEEITDDQIKKAMNLWSDF